MIRTATPTAKSCGRPLAISVPLGGRIRPSPGCPAAGVTSLSTPYFFSTALPSSPDPLFAAAASFDGPPKDAFSQQQKQQQHASSYHVPKAWLDESRPVERRVQELLEASTVHPADFSLLQGLVKQCCQRGTLEGMQLAQDVMDRLLVEKKRWQQRQQSGSSGVETLLASSPPDGDKNNNDNKTIHSTITNMKTPIVIVPMNLFQTLLYGWACLAGNLRVAQTRMDQVLQLALEEAKQDDAAILTVNQSKPNDIDINDNSSASRSTMNDAEWQPTVQLFNTYLFGLSKAARLSPQAALHGEATLYEMAEHSRKFGWHTKPNTRSYTLVFMAYANAAPHNAAASSRALKLLSTMKQVHTSERLEYDREYAIPYNAQVRHPGVLSATPPENDAPNSTNRRQIVTPDTIVYTTIMKALIATKPHINDKAGCSDEVITLFGEALQSESVGLDAGLFLMTLSSLSATIETQGSARVRIEIAKQADQVLDFMKMALENVPLVAYTNKISNVRSDMTLTSRTTTTAAEGLLMGYNACMDTWARAYCEEAAPKCQAMLQDMIKGRVNNILPNTVSFNTCMYGKIAEKFSRFVKCYWL